MLRNRKSTNAAKHDEAATPDEKPASATSAEAQSAKIAETDSKPVEDRKRSTREARGCAAASETAEARRHGSEAPPLQLRRR